MDLHFDCSDPAIFLKLNEHSWKVPFYQTRIELDELMAKHRHDPVPPEIEMLKAERARLLNRPGDGERLAQVEADLISANWGRDPKAEEKNVAFFEGVREFLSKSGGPALNTITRGNAERFWDSFFPSWAEARAKLILAAPPSAATASSPPSTDSPSSASP